MKLTIKLTCDNAAFNDSGDPSDEVARILRKYAARIERDGVVDSKLFDINGNTVGTVKVVNGGGK